MAEHAHRSERDLRYVALRKGLEQLDRRQLAVLVRHIQLGEPLVVDGCNYDPTTGAWCPLAVALDVRRMAERENRRLSTDAEAREYILSVGRRFNPEFGLNPMSGIAGTFFTAFRRRDLLRVSREVLNEGTFFRGRERSVVAP